MKELENHRVERLSLGAAQNRLEKQIEAIAQHLGIKSSNGNHKETARGKSRARTKRGNQNEK